MMILVDPRNKLAVQPGDISSIQINRETGGRRVLVLMMTSGQELRVSSNNDGGDLNIDAVHKQLMEASK